MLEDEIKVAQRRMLRKIFGSRRQMAQNTDTSSESTESESSEKDGASNDELETWAEWLKRTTSQVEDINTRLGIEDW
eukprot:4300952-Karenia_brevis.AAC.1